MVSAPQGFETSQRTATRKAIWMSNNNPSDHFKIMILTGRPASGKSEIIAYLNQLPLIERIRQFHIARLDFIDDFSMLWTWFEEDMLLSRRLGKPRLHTDEQGFFLHDYQWQLLIERIGLEYQKKMRDHPDYHRTHTTLVEFSRGSQHGGYAAAFPHLPVELLKRAVILYVKVSFEESLRKNRRRFNPAKPDSILEHGLPDDKLKILYERDDWTSLTAGDPEYLEINGVAVPYAEFENADDVTTQGGEPLAARLEETLSRLWQLKHAIA
jgi:hypothetical protein